MCAELHSRYNGGRVTPPFLASPVALVAAAKRQRNPNGSFSSYYKLSRPANLKSRIVHDDG
jgi:hypothetical protein